MKEKTPREYRDVVIVGNGPSGLFMSYLLSGKCPTYNGGNHPELILDSALNCLGSGRCLYDADLITIAQSVEGNGTPIGILMDKLLRPGADIGLDMPSLIDWRCHKSLDHVVIGKGPPGGIWHTIEGDTLTLSPSNWMELPGFPFTEFENSEGPKRVKASIVARYYTQYARKMNLQQYMKRGVVNCIRPYEDLTDDENKTNWVVEGNDLNGARFSYKCKYVVLASGTYDSPNVLGVEGEDLPWVYHSLKDFEDEFDSAQSVLIVGAGLSAADAVRACRFRLAEVHHVFRNPKNPMEKSLHSSMYPDYHKIWQMMNIGDAKYPGYFPYRGCSVLSFYEEGRERYAKLRYENGTVESVQINLVVILIGSTADLRYTQKEDLGLTTGPVHSRGNSVLIDPTTSEVLRLPNCFAIGSLAGENFVRNITGAAVMAAARIYKFLQ
ncbi:oxidative stress-induced growth inhibitor 2-like [Cimex lectularius]|uniref:Oxidative stress-induced growth inhibitor n=1 Tax=Cimex lectularius TaxID=79782 RepID=A0A8I6S7S0_CIMLE|nr:oxidative stress-induced growth inhibitor 2-like [Cimex lectularius]